METPSQTYSIVRANKENIGDLGRIFKESRGIDVSVEYLRRKFDTHYTGKTYFAHFAYDQEGNPAAFFCLFPCFLRVDGKKVLAGQSADIITHHLHQRKGLFGMLGKATEELAAAEGMDYLFAFPNDNSFPGFTRSLHWHEINQFQVHAFRSGALPIYRALTKFKLYGLYARWSKFILKKATAPQDGFEGADMASNANVHWREAGYFSYKQYNPSFMITLDGMKIWAKIEGRLVVGDIQLLKPIQVETVIAGINKLCRNLGLEEWIMETSKGAYWDNKFKGMSELREGVRIVYKNLRKPTDVLSLNFVGSDADVF